MALRSRLWRVLLPVAVALLAVPLVQRAVATEAPVGDACAGDHWVAAWTAASQGSSLGRPDDGAFGLADGPARTFTDQTLRMVVSPSSDGSAVRVRFGNRFSPIPMQLASATIGRGASGAAAVPGSLEPLRFGGEPSVVVPAGAELLSDPVFVPVAAGEQLLVTFHLVGAAAPDHHQWAQSTQYVTAGGAGDHAFDTGAAAFVEELTSWYGVIGVDVLAPRAHGAVVAFGDSITDGIGSSPNLARRWPDRLNERLRAAGMRLGVVNAGLGGNHVTTDGRISPVAIGPSALDRIGVDALRLHGVTDVILFEGINDVYMSGGEGDVVARVISGYRVLAERAHAAGVRVIGVTLTPASLDGTREAARLEINRWLRSTDVFDAIVDFDAVARDDAQPSRLRPEWDAGMAHLTDDGYAALAAAFPIGALRGTGC